MLDLYQTWQRIRLRRQAISHLLQNGSRTLFPFPDALCQAIQQKMLSKFVQQLLRDASRKRSNNRQIKIPKINFFRSMAYQLFLNDSFYLLFFIQCTGITLLPLCYMYRLYRIAYSSARYVARHSPLHVQ